MYVGAIISFNGDEGLLWGQVLDMERTLLTVKLLASYRLVALKSWIGPYKTGGIRIIAQAEHGIHYLLPIKTIVRYAGWLSRPPNRWRRFRASLQHGQYRYRLGYWELRQRVKGYLFADGFLLAQMGPSRGRLIYRPQYNFLKKNNPELWKLITTTPPAMN